MVNEALTHLPPEMIEKILSRLPVKSLLRFKSLCKSWNALISSHPFIRTHLLYSSHALCIEEEYSNLLRFQHRQFHVHPLPPAVGNYAFIRYWGSCNGILFLEDRSIRDLVLWNPSMRKSTKLSLPNFSSPIIYPWRHLKTSSTKLYYSIKDYRYRNYGFCYDPATFDLKVVVFYGENNYSVYSCKNKSWSKQHVVIPDDIKSYSVHARDMVCVDGALYWIIRFHSCELRTQLCGDLVCFESEGDKIKTVQRPSDLKERDEFCLISLRGRLCVWCCSADESLVRIWMREEGEVWRDFMRIEDIPHPYSYYLHRYHVNVNVDEGDENIEIMVCLGSRRKIMVYHPRQKTYEEFDVPRTQNASEFALSGSEDEDTQDTKVTQLFSSVDSLLFFD